MKAAVWHSRRDVQIEDVPEPPPPPPGQVKVKVVWCGICGTGLHEYLGGPLSAPPGMAVGSRSMSTSTTTRVTSCSLRCPTK